MKEIMNEYGAVIIGGLAAMCLIGLVFLALSSNGILHNAFAAYLDSIC